MATVTYRKPRLVTIDKKGRSNFGFNLHGLKGKPGQTVKSVDEDGAAYEAGVFAGDRILAVNNDSVVGETHTMVVERIRRANDKVVILLIDEESYDYCNARGIPVEADTATVLSNEHKPVKRDNLLPPMSPARKVSASSESSPPKSPTESTASADGTGKTTHTFVKRKTSKRDEAKNAKTDWAARMAAFDNL